MEQRRTRAALLLLLATALAGCVDVPTASNAAAGGTALKNDYVLEPIIVIGEPEPKECDPYTDLNWCQGDGGVCTTSISPADDPFGTGVQSCPGGTAGGGGGGQEEETEDSDICPQPLMGKTATALVDVAGRNHQFQFSGTMWRVNPAVGRSPAWYYISGPTLSEDGWWMAESGKVQLVCWGRWRFRNSLWVGTVYVQATDLHLVMAPGHPDF
jgi:hypothetical protein